jgi:hypothetical protein
MGTIIRLLAAALAFVWFATATALSATDKKVALVIGNSAYAHVPVLPNPIRDAEAMATTLSGLGFTVISGVDLDYQAMRLKLLEFGDIADGADIALVFYAGHGIEIDRQNYMVPIDAKLESDRAVNFQALPLDLVMTAVDGATKLKLVMLDACRDNPFLTSMRRTSATRSVGRGLARVEPDVGTLVSYAAREGTTASDGDLEHSPYTTALLKRLQEPGLEISILFRQVRDDVLDATGKKQEPFTYGSLPGSSIYIVPPVEGGRKPETAAPVPVVPVTETPKPVADDPAKTAWDAVSDTESAAILEVYVAQFGDTIYGSFAKARLAELNEGKQKAAVAEQERIAQERAAAELSAKAAADAAAKAAADAARQAAEDAARRAAETATKETQIASASPGTWFVVMGSYTSERTARSKLSSLNKMGAGATMINSNDYAGLRDGLWVVVKGPFSKSSATQQLTSAKRIVGDAYIKDGK